nr:uncharacterized protein LOC109156749 [Ipomoea batatas]
MKRNFETLSTMGSQRYSDENDPLERSTNKPKVDDGSQDETDSSAAEGSPSAMVPDTNVNTEFEAVAETQLEEMPGADRQDSDMHIESDPTPIPAPVAEPAQPLPVDPNQVNSGAARPRSYLDSVVGQGTDAAPFLVDNTTDAGCPSAAEGVMGGSEGSVAPHPPQSVGTDCVNAQQGIDKGKATTSRTRPYGSWMIVTRKERRQSGRPQGSGQPRESAGPTVTAGNANGASGAGGSRFAPLETEPVPVTDSATNTNCAMESDGINHGHNSDNIQNAVPAQSRGSLRRSNVIANERQIVNEPHQAQATTGAERTVTGRVSPRRGSRRAAEEDDHVINRGENGGSTIRTTRVTNQEPVQVPLPAVNQDHMDNALDAAGDRSPEHHTDPPDCRNGEGDTIMEDDMPQELDISISSPRHSLADNFSLHDAPLLKDLESSSENRTAPILRHQNNIVVKSLRRWSQQPRQNNPIDSCAGFPDIHLQRLIPNTLALSPQNPLAIPPQSIASIYNLPSLALMLAIIVPVNLYNLVFVSHPMPSRWFFGIPKLSYHS